jgi:RecB family exonuclease
VAGRPARPLSMAGLVSELRRTVADPANGDALRAAAARRLAGLARETVAGRALVPQADPANWWGTRAASRSIQPLREEGEPVPVSASLLEGVLICPTRWFLEREAGGVARAHQSANLGEIVHAIAQRVATGELAAGADDVDLLMEQVDAVWGRLEFRTPWSRAREHERVRQALAKFLRWHHANPRTVLGTEQRFATEVVVEGGERVTLTGYADRLELAADGRVVVVDLKTARTAPTGPQVQRHVQLGLYQLAVDRGAVDELAPGAIAGGAELVQLGLEDGKPDAVVQGQVPQPDDGPERLELEAQVGSAAALLREESFPALVGQHCQSCDFVAICPARSAGAVVAQ